MALNVNDLTAAIEAGFDREYLLAKGTPAADAGKEDRRIMFAAVARGVLQYLKAHQSELLETITTRDQSGNTFNFNVETTSLGIDPR